MLDPALKEMYLDAQAYEELENVTERAALNYGKEIYSAWKAASDRIESIILRVGALDMAKANALLEKWRNAREIQEDFRALAAYIQSDLKVEMQAAIRLMYGSIRAQNKELEFTVSSSGFFTVKDLKMNRYLHSPEDPMREAYLLAKDLFRPEMTEFHILGCGLGYLAWQLWLQSEKTLKLIIYEDDRDMLAFADRLGVLRMMETDAYEIVDPSDVDLMLQRFLAIEESPSCGRYVSDWKVHGYNDTGYGDDVRELDFNGRTHRIFDLLWKINIRENSKKELLSVSGLQKDYGLFHEECIVVSAGPSLDDNIEFLKSSIGTRTIIVINAAFKRLALERIRPDVVVTLDPTARTHIEGVEGATKGIPLVTTRNANHCYVAVHQGPVYLIPEERISENGFIWNFGGTVASLALDLAFYLGAKRVFLIGSDLAFSEGRNYAGGIAHTTSEGINNDLMIPAADGGMVRTNRIYNTYREILEGQIAVHSDVQVYNLSRHGAYIAGTQSYLS